MSKFAARSSFSSTQGWALLPFRFERFSPERVLLTNIVGEHLFVSQPDFQDLVDGDLSQSDPLFARLRAKHLIRVDGDELPLDLLAMKMWTRYRRLPDFTALHILVVSLRCEHSCPYCQVSRRSADKSRYDMSWETAERALSTVFRSPSPYIKIEFQGGEPLLNFDLIKEIVPRARALADQHSKHLSFVIASNLALLNEEMLDFCAHHQIGLSTSLDGPADLHNRNRPRPGNDSWERATEGIRRAQERLGIDQVSALMTTTLASLDRVEEIIDCYVEHGLRDVFLRPLSPYGFAIKTKSFAAYDIEQWLQFYERGVDHILDLNSRGVDVVERYSAIVLKKMLTNDDPGYVDLMSPAGIGTRALVYNYDGVVYASDEGRMLAEMGDTTFRLGNLAVDTYEDIIQSDVLLDSLEHSLTLSAPMCTDCAFEPYCGSDPVFHHATQGDVVGHKPTSAFCQRNMGVFRFLLGRYDADPDARTIFHSWANR